MRCARCDQVAMPQVLARTPDGVLVFGWCAECLAAEGCEIVEVEPAAIVVAARRISLRRRVRHAGVTIRRWVRTPRSLATSRRLGALGIAGLMAAWALVLAFVGGLKMIGSDDGKGLMLLTGSGVMAIVSLGVWVSLIAKGDRAGVVLKVVQVSALVIAIGTVAWGIVRRRTGDWTGIIGVATAGVLMASFATMLQRRKVAARTGRKQPRRTVS